ncbi:gluconokinase [Reichenbachiella agarivorans]|uniref:Gluconokinase n=1 Tax=Reichenbachiella agarivorans TaxID=2979464 RepID=A0ABY6CQ79_9BACT|nr:gluconokinase [Reichenbachiella agarivorans]UXP32679.1 gluconokinase [Reichenbachiella agarivorans]
MSKETKPIIVVLGVSGSGKSTIGAMLGEAIDVPFYDGDDFHPKANKDKMAAGHPLDDEDREPWLLALARHIETKSKERGAIIACSALKEKYRETLSQYYDGDIIWVYLHGDQKTLAERLSARKGHFFDPKLLANQLEVLEAPAYAWRFDISQAPKQIVAGIVDLMNR